MSPAGAVLPSDAQHAEIRQKWNTFAERYNSVPGQHTYTMLEHFLHDEGGSLAQKRVLDLACGPGRGSRLLAARGATVEGVDLSETMLERARSENGLPNIRYQHAAAESLPFEDGSFDAAFCCLALMIFPEPTAALRELRRVLRPGAPFHVVVWGRREPSTLMTLFEDVASELGLEFPQLPRTNWHLGSPERLAEIAEGTGLTLQSHRYILHPFPSDRGRLAKGFGLDEPGANPRLEFLPAAERARFAEAVLDEGERRLTRDGGVLTLDALLGVYA